jgi:hypothetical protein
LKRYLLLKIVPVGEAAAVAGGYLADDSPMLLEQAKECLLLFHG